jgi:hypothetical protein
LQCNTTFREEVINESGQQIGIDGQSDNYWTKENHKGMLDKDWILANQPITTRTVLANDHSTKRQSWEQETHPNE